MPKKKFTVPSLEKLLKFTRSLTYVKTIKQNALF